MMERTSAPIAPASAAVPIASQSRWVFSDPLMNSTPPSVTAAPRITLSRVSNQNFLVHMLVTASQVPAKIVNVSCYVSSCWVNGGLCLVRLVQRHDEPTEVLLAPLNGDVGVQPPCRANQKRAYDDYDYQPTRWPVHPFHRLR